ncbi:porin family protein [Vibrio cholerae]|uniref:porin family protein n=2 Tax=Vibrio cholerae TaxID=666 RepID=UPI00096B8F33|nr:porin family protein [Vibrio cholerae]EGQ7879412.1 porin family protein [Vibrio cholerae]EGQ9319596.1 porin family protein [Vibrio cholerae]EGQ9434865.1 porin family protein [Vibrio cholerae]EGQ9609780.1 porin family protein [Vibrio cholerae]EGQ9633507.1 porin family protein [Vibrio cholerae]
MRQINLFILNTLFLLFAPLSAAEWIVTPSVGYTLGGKVLDQAGRQYDLENSSSYALAIETTYDNGRIGLFYSTQPTEVQTLVNQDASIHYLHFQSSIYYPVAEKLSSFIGLGIGGAYTDVAWADKKFGFSAGAFGGVEYRVASNVALNAQLRWLGTMVDNDSSAICTLPSSESCVVKFKSDWLNQASAYVGFTIRF